MEPLVSSKIKQLDIISEQRRNTSLSHRFHCIKKERKMKKNIARKLHANVETFNDSYVSFGCDDDLDEQDYSSSNDCDISDVTPEDGGMKTRRFDEMTTFENKTICLISRYPFWTAFRRFLSHLHILSGSTSDLPLERFISHLVLSVPVPKPGSQCILVPLTCLAGPMVISMPPTKDLPLLDLSFQRLFSCLDIPTVVTIVLGFLTLEKKVSFDNVYNIILLKNSFHML